MHFIVSLRTNFMYHFVHCLTVSAIIIMTQYLCFIPQLLKEQTASPTTAKIVLHISKKRKKPVIHLNI